MSRTSSAFAGPQNRELLDAQYSRWQANPDSVEPSWQAFFSGVEFAGNGIAERVESSSVRQEARLQAAAARIITAYRDLGHLAAHIDPLLTPEEQATKPSPWHLSETRFKLGPGDLDAMVDGSMVFGIDGPIRLGELIAVLKETYCRTVGVEFMHIQDTRPRMWLAGRMEPNRNRFDPGRATRLRTLMTLHWAELFEKYLHTKFLGQKRFSLEGGETLIPVLDAIVHRGPSLGVKEFVIGMAHRGRLNVLANILQKPFAEIFNEFQDNHLPDAVDGDGDVKYHMGFSAEVATPEGGTVHVSLSPNPSHLEAVNAIVEGRVRAKQRLHNDSERTQGVPILLHGDAAFAGQGMVMETLNLANLHGYRTGGTIHVVVNNQIGFTTNPRDARSTQYCTDIAKFIQAPIFHINAEDVDAAVHIAQMALEYRQEFKSDVVLDLVCFRKYGHNETDEPSYTQPLEYKRIRAKQSVTAVYTEQLVREGSISQDEADAIDSQFRERLDLSLEDVKTGPPRKKGMKGFIAGPWVGMKKTYSHDPVETAVPKATIDKIANQLVSVPDTFTIHPKLKEILSARRDAILTGKTIDWGGGETLAYGSLLLDGHPVRLSGQDCRRGTFSHRHAMVYDYETGEPYCPLDRFEPRAAPFDVFDSTLSEAAVLGFEYGYALDDPNTLVLWEAQFGDFANGAQVIIDQFIASGESKWNRANGLVMLLPHGYEGQGPEHSSARLERFLQLCAEDNMQVCNFTTPASLFHALRRQIKRNFRKPLIVMTPKSLLRHPQAVSTMEDFTTGRFQDVLDDPLGDPKSVRRLILCSGKVYYDLAAKRPDDAAIIRLEQLYPWPEEQLNAVLKPYHKSQTIAWVQEESHNNGAWFFVEPRLRAMGLDPICIARDASASPATGSHLVHSHEQNALVEQAFTATTTQLITLGTVKP
jgi:2-oxoglutarate dehydrogenase E1 component